MFWCETKNRWCSCWCCEQGECDLEELKEYNVTIKGATESTTVGYAGYGECVRDGIYYNVVAWQPLPDAYKVN